MKKSQYFLIKLLKVLEHMQFIWTYSLYPRRRFEFSAVTQKCYILCRFQRKIANFPTKLKKWGEVVETLPTTQDLHDFSLCSD